MSGKRAREVRRIRARLNAESRKYREWVLVNIDEVRTNMRGANIAELGLTVDSAGNVTGPPRRTRRHLPGAP